MIRARLRLPSSGSRGAWCVALGLVLAACTVSTQDIDFLPDAEFHSGQGGSGGPVGGGGFTADPGGAGMAPMGGTGAESCTDEGAARCTEAGELQVCKSGAYATIERCQSEATCSAARGRCLDCAPGTFRCSKDTLEQCNLEGSAYEIVRVCEPDACEADGHSGYCVVCEPDTALCEPGERDFEAARPDLARRARARHSLRRCNAQGSGTEAVDTCDSEQPVCDADAEACLACKPGAVTCHEGVLSRCSEDGTELEPEEDCGHPALCDAQRGRCLASECAAASNESETSGDLACRGATGTELSRCTASGQWEILDLCDSASACEHGTVPRRCLDAADAFCVPGTSSCDGQTLQRCAGFSEPDSFGPNGGAWYPFATCAGSCEVTGSGIAECVGGDEYRPYTDAVVCAPGDPGYLDCSGSSCVEVTCPEGELCAGSGIGCRACIPGNARCDGNVLVRCAEDGSGEEEVEDCGDGVCDRYRGVCLPAPAGERFCQGGDLSRVALDGTIQTIERCGSPTLCSAEHGCREPNCVAGARICGGEQGRQVFECVDGLELKALPTRCASADRCEDGLGCVAAIRVAAGEAHTCALVLPQNGDADALGLVKCWGANERGQLGNGAALLGDEPEARPVVFRESESGTPTVSARFVGSALCAGKDFTCAEAKLRDGFGVVCWGNNEQGQLGIGTLSNGESAAPANAVTLPVTRGEDVAPRDGVPDAFVGLASVTCGANFACALDPDGHAWCWGANDVGQLGGGQATQSPVPVAQRVGGRSDRALVFRSLSAGAQHVCGLDREGGLWCWGGGAKGQLGQRTREGSATPTRYGEPVRAYLLGRDFTIVLPSDAAGAATAFGQNFFGQLATGDSVAVDAPVAAGVLDGAAITGLVGGPMAAHGCALMAGSLACWGANALGQLGDGTRQDRYAPVTPKPEVGSIDLLAEPGSVALGRSHTCAIDASGGVWCWGGNQRKQLGSDVSQPWMDRPVRVLNGRR